MKLSRWIKAVALGLCGCLVLSLFSFGQACEDISGRVLRLHVLAASDSEEDQALKFKVRDAILASTDGLLDGIESSMLAKEMLQNALPTIKAAAERCLLENGSSDGVTVELCETYFTTREYDTVTLPAGTYDALRVTIGAGEGKNWWCVVFPPMCLSGASGRQLDDVLTEREEIIVTQPQRFEVRFKLIEWYHGICRWFSGQ